MIRHHPALLSLPEEQLAEIMEDLRACLAPETESELLTAIRKQPTLLVLGAARSLKDKVNVHFWEVHHAGGRCRHAQRSEWRSCTLLHRLCRVARFTRRVESSL